MPGKLVILIGPPAAGKSTWLQQFQGEVISTDQIRSEFGVQFDLELEPAVWRTAYQRLEALLAAGRVVCFDATNTTKERRRPLLRIARRYQAEVEGVVFIEERDVLLERNASRPPGKKVPEGVLIEKLQELELPSFDEGFDRIEVFD